MDKRGLVRAFQRYLLNPVARHVAGQPGVPRYVLLETVGRRTGRPRRVPVGAAVNGRTLWVVAEHGRASDWVRNLDHDPRVRVRRGGRWLRGRARVLTADDPEDALRRQGPIGRTAVRLAGTDLLPVRIDLEG